MFINKSESNLFCTLQFVSINDEPEIYEIYDDKTSNHTKKNNCFSGHFQWSMVSQRDFKILVFNQFSFR